MEGYLSEQIFYFSWPYAYDKALAFEKAAREIWDMLPFKYDVNTGVICSTILSFVSRVIIPVWCSQGFTLNDNLQTGQGI
jgi:hypothetical protein